MIRICDINRESIEDFLFSRRGYISIGILTIGTSII